MPALSTARQNAIVLALLLAVQLFLMSDGGERNGAAAVLQSWIMRLSSPAVRLGELVGGGLLRGITETREVFTARARNAVLEAELQRLDAELVQHREAKLENRRLRRLLGMREQMAPDSIAASVVTSNQSGRTRMIIADRGGKDGVKVDLPVVAWGGAVGRVVAVDPSHSKIRLLTDASSGVAGVVQRSRARGIVAGRDGGALYMLYVPRFSDVLHDDRVVTSGLDGIFPRGFGIGRIGSIQELPDGTQTIHLVPELNYAALEEVLILLDPGAIDLEPDPETEPADP